MTRQPLHRRALRIELPAAEPTIIHASATGRQSWRLGRARIVVAVASPVLRTVVGSGLRALGLDPQRVTTRAGLYGVVATDPDLVILSDPFDRAPLLPVIASLRTAGHRGALVVLGHASRPLRARAAQLGVTLIADPILGATVAGPWLRQCLTAPSLAL